MLTTRRSEVRVRIATALARGDRDLAADLGEDGPALCVIGTFLTLDLGPLRMTGHRPRFYMMTLLEPVDLSLPRLALAGPNNAAPSPEGCSFA